jgi:hypothetical protein
VENKTRQVNEFETTLMLKQRVENLELALKIYAESSKLMLDLIGKHREGIEGHIACTNEILKMISIQAQQIQDINKFLAENVAQELETIH